MASGLLYRVYLKVTRSYSIAALISSPKKSVIGRSPPIVLILIGRFLTTYPCYFSVASTLAPFFLRKEYSIISRVLLSLLLARIAKLVLTICIDLILDNLRPNWSTRATFISVREYSLYGYPAGSLRKTRLFFIGCVAFSAVFLGCAVISGFMWFRFWPFRVT